MFRRVFKKRTIREANIDAWKRKNRLDKLVNACYRAPSPVAFHAQHAIDATVIAELHKTLNDASLADSFRRVEVIKCLGELGGTNQLPR